MTDDLGCRVLSEPQPGPGLDFGSFPECPGMHQNFFNSCLTVFEMLQVSDVSFVRRLAPPYRRRLKTALFRQIRPAFALK